MSYIRIGTVALSSRYPKFRHCSDCLLILWKMLFKETKLKGAYLIELEPAADERGYFARTYCREEFEKQGLNPRVAQCNVSYNRRKGTLRGFHYQIPPCAETKLFRCIRGAVFDVIIDLRADSPTYKKWFGVELSADNCKMLYVPRNFAQGFITLADDTELSYQVSEFYSPGYEKGIRYNDPAFAVAWPIPIEVISTKDENWPNYMV
jgi:dTDP-4-dehydrorhamnose 3,5-epimerase